MAISTVEPTGESLLQSNFASIGPEEVKITFGRPVKGAELVTYLRGSQGTLDLYYGSFEIKHGKEGFSPVLFCFENEVPGGSFAVIPSKEKPLIVPDESYDSITLIAVSPPPSRDWETLLSMPQSSASKLKELTHIAGIIERNYSA